jgi:hypothetical protein
MMTENAAFQHAQQPAMATYFYRVDEYVSTFGRSQGQEESFSHSLDFYFDTLQESKQQAYDYYNDRLSFLSKEGAYFLPFAPVKDTSLGDIAIYSLTLYFVECYNEDEYYLHGLEGVSEEEKEEAKEVEWEVFNLDE